MRIIQILELRTSACKSKIGDAEQLSGKQKQERRSLQISNLAFRTVLALKGSQNIQLVDF